MPMRQFLEPRRIQELSSNCCPASVSAYAAQHLDSFEKILNHTLLVNIVCDIILFLSSWGVSYVSILGSNTVMVSFLLCSQCIILWLILNNSRMPSTLGFLAPTEFMIGVALGITIGAAILSWNLSSTYSQIGRCQAEVADALKQPGTSAAAGNQTDANYLPPSAASVQTKTYLYQDACDVRLQGSTTAVWFWASVSFWLNVWSCVILAIGRQDFTQAATAQYQNIGGGMTMDDYQDHFQRYQQQQQQQQQSGGGTFAGGAPSPSPSMPSTTGFVGDYTTVPEIRTGQGSGQNGTGNTNLMNV